MDPTRRRLIPSRTATAASVLALLTLALAAAGFLGLYLGLLDPLLAHGMLVVAIGGTILGVTISAVGLLVTRHRRDPVGRRRAWLGAGLSLLLLLALWAAFEVELGGPIVVEETAQVRVHGTGG